MVVNNMIKDNVISRLMQLGLSEYEARAYISLLKESPASAYEIAKNSGIPTSKIYEVIKKLQSRKMVQSIHGDRSRIFIPQSPDEFASTIRLAMEDSLGAIKEELKEFKTDIETDYTWSIRDYDGLILKAKRIIDTAESTILLSIWPQEMELLLNMLTTAEARGVKVIVVHYGATNIKIGRIFKHPVEDTIYAQGDIRGFAITVDSKEALICNISRKKIEAIWSMNSGFVIMVEEYIRHDIYLVKVITRFAPLLKEKFGDRYEGLRDI